MDSMIPPVCLYISIRPNNLPAFPFYGFSDHNTCPALFEWFHLSEPEKRAGQRFLPALEKRSFTFVIVILCLIR